MGSFSLNDIIVWAPDNFDRLYIFEYAGSVEFVKGIKAVPIPGSVVVFAEDGLVPVTGSGYFSFDRCRKATPSEIALYEGVVSV